MKIAMWSGPRNLSTAMMYSFGARGDCAISDEPFYAAFLKETGLRHPMGREIMSTMESNPDRVIRQLCGSNPNGLAHWYQKHMCHHMIAGIERTWIAEFKNVFLIRHPERVVASYAAKRENPTLEDLGFEQQCMIFDEVTALGQTPIIVDSYDIRQNPKNMMQKLCDALDLRYAPSMLSWPEGGHADDGIWARHWYGAVHRSTGFAGAEGTLPKAAGPLARVVKDAMPYYQRLALHKIT